MKYRLLPAHHHQIATSRHSRAHTALRSRLPLLTPTVRSSSVLYPRKSAASSSPVQPDEGSTIPTPGPMPEEAFSRSHGRLRYQLGFPSRRSARGNAVGDARRDTSRLRFRRIHSPQARLYSTRPTDLRTNTGEGVTMRSKASRP